ncbi:MAG TPA: peptidylprolyl isomerase [Leptolyngbyaceae cyanobacterium]
MEKDLTILSKDILEQVKLSCQIPTVVEAIATRKIIKAAANQVGIKTEAEELQQAANSLRQANKLLKAEDTWEWLEKHHLSLDDFEELAYTNLLSKKLAIHLFGNEVERIFYEHQLDYTGAVIYQVILDDEDLALELFYALQEGEITFQELARQYIQEPEIRRAGGYLGIQRRAEMKAEIAAAVFAATPPQILKPIMTQKGVHLIRVEEIIQPQLDEQLRVKILGDLFTNWLKQQIAELKIVIQMEDKNLQTEVDEHKLANAN